MGSQADLRWAHSSGEIRFPSGVASMPLNAPTFRLNEMCGSRSRCVSPALSIALFHRAMPVWQSGYTAFPM